MADKDTQGQDDTLWWELDALPDPSTFGPGFDEPLVWPESLVWDETSTSGAGLGEPLPLPDAPPIDFDADLFPPETEAQAVAPSPPPAPADDLGVNWTGNDTEVTAYLVDPLAALGGGAGAQAQARPVVTGDRLPESIWAEAPKTRTADGLLVSTSPAATAFYAEADGAERGRKHRRLGIRPGNAGVIALISLVSLVLLGMFLSVRARNDVPTDASQTRLPPGDGIAVSGTLQTVPLTTTITTTVAPNAIDIGALVPPTETTEATTGSGSGAPAPTAAPRASAPAAGTATTTATTAPATQTTTATTAPPPPTTEATTPTTAAPPVDDTEPPRRTTTSFTLPSIPTTTVPGSTNTSFPFPSLPSIPTSDRPS
jgi:hypothetical protein